MEGEIGMTPETEEGMTTLGIGAGGIAATPGTVSVSLGNDWVENVSARVLTDTQLLNCG